MAEPAQLTSKNSILVTTAATTTLPVPKSDLKDYLQNIVGRNTEVTLKDTKNSKETIVQFDSKNGTFCN